MRWLVFEMETYVSQDSSIDSPIIIRGIKLADESERKQRILSVALEHIHAMARVVVPLYCHINVVPERYQMYGAAATKCMYEPAVDVVQLGSPYAVLATVSGPDGPTARILEIAQILREVDLHVVDPGGKQQVVAAVGCENPRVCCTLIQER